MRDTEHASSKARQLPRALKFRATLSRADVESVQRMTDATGFFSGSEVEIAVELVEAALEIGAASGYSFLLAERGDTFCGYTCFGPVPCTADSFDLYWIVVEAACQGQGVGKRLLARREATIHEMGGRRLYAETSARSQYRPTRAFYRHTGFRQVARLEDFYAPGDDKIIYCKTLSQPSLE